MKIIYQLYVLLTAVLLLSNCTSKAKDSPDPDKSGSYKDKVVLYDLEVNADTSQVKIDWSSLTGDDFVGYELYRTEISDATLNAEKVDATQFQLLARFSAAKATSYTDPLPYGSFFRYIVVARKSSGTRYYVSNVKEVRINNRHYVKGGVREIFHNPATGQMLIFLKSTAALAVYDYNGNMLRQVSLPDKSIISQTHCFGAMGTFNGKAELYIPTSDVIYIYNPATLDLIDRIDTQRPYMASVSSYGNLIFANGAIIDRQTKKIIQNPGNRPYFENGGREFPAKNKTSNFINSFYISLNILPTDFGVNYYYENGKHVSTVPDSYHGTYPLSPGLCKVAPNGLYLITDSRGAVYDYTLKFQRYITGNATDGNWPNGGMFMDFEFSDDSSLIYAAMTNGKTVNVYNANFTLLKSIPLNDYPVRIFRKNNELIVAIAERSVNEAIVTGDLSYTRMRFQRVKL